MAKSLHSERGDRDRLGSEGRGAGEGGNIVHLCFTTPGWKNNNSLQPKCPTLSPVGHERDGGGGCWRERKREMEKGVWREMREIESERKREEVVGEREREKEGVMGSERERETETSMFPLR